MWRYLAFQKFGTIAFETLLLVGCVLTASYIRFHVSWGSSPDWNHVLPKALAFALVFQFYLHLGDVYDFRRTRPIAESAFRLVRALLLATATLWALYLLFPALSVGKGVFGMSLALSAFALILWHMLLRLYYRARKPRSGILVLGTGRLARELAREILRRPELGMGIRGFVDDDPALVGVSIVNPSVLGLYHDLPRIVATHKVDHIVVELEDRRGRLPIDDLLDFKSRGMVVEEATSLYERVTGKIALENLKPSWMIFNSGFECSQKSRHFKQAVDYTSAGLLTIAMLPLFGIIALLIKLTSRGPVFIRQNRVGKDGRTFALWKFRSMREDAERQSGPVWAKVGDSRVTLVGRFLRRFRLDEFPQIWNVLLGDMSLVGPRPERPEFVQDLQTTIPFYQVRHSVKPGITGWAQVNYQYANSVKDTTEKLQYDLFYVKHMSMLLDALILLDTVKVVLVRRGS